MLAQYKFFLCAKVNTTEQFCLLLSASDVRLSIWINNLEWRLNNLQSINQPIQESRIDNSVYISVSLNIINVLLFLSRKNEDPRVDSPDLSAELEIR